MRGSLPHAVAVARDRGFDLRAHAVAGCFGGDLDRVAEGAGLAAAVRLEEQVREAEQRRAAVFAVVGDVLEPLQPARQEDEPEPPQQALLERPLAEALE